jgi:hypothetical protein
LASRTMKQLGVTSAVHGGGKRRDIICWSHWSKTKGRFRLLSATMNCGNDDPDRVGHLRGMGDRGSGPGSRAGLRTGSDFTAQRPFNSLIIVNKNVDKTFSTTDEAACPQKYARPAMSNTAIKSRAASARTTKKRGCKSNAGSDVPQ